MAKSNATFTYLQDGHLMICQRRRGVWVFTCPDFPEIAKKFDGAAGYGPALVAFQRRCLIGGVRRGGPPAVAEKITKKQVEELARCLHESIRDYEEGTSWKPFEKESANSAKRYRFAARKLLENPPPCFTRAK